jgi:hypothetical protein
MPDPVETVANSASWSEYGLAGMVIAALLALIVWGMRIFVARLDASEVRHAAERTEFLTRHQAERKEWKDEANLREDRLLHVLSDLKHAIRETRNHKPQS